MSYFKFFPKRDQYKVILENESKTSEVFFRVSFPDFFRNAALVYPKIQQGKFFYETINILDGERPDQLSQRLYKTVNYWWTFFFINEHLRLGETLQWTLSEFELNQKINEDYKGVTLVFDRDDFAVPGQNPFGNFIIGETVQGQTTGITGTILNLRPKFGQMMVYNSEFPEEEFDDGETIVGLTSGESMPCIFCALTSESVCKYIDYETGREIDDDTAIYTDSLSVVPPGHTATSISFRDNQVLINDRLKNIRVLKADSVRDFVNTFRKTIRKNRIS